MMQPLVLDSVVEPKSKHSSEFEEFNAAYVLSEQVCWIFIRADIEDFDFLVFDQLPDVVVANVYVF